MKMRHKHSSAYNLIELFLFWYWVVWILYIFWISCRTYISYLLSSCRLPFCFADGFDVQKFSNLNRSHLFVFAFVALAIGGISKEILVRLMSEKLLPTFSSRNFMAWDLIFKSLILFEFIFVYDRYKGVVQFHPSPCSCSVFPKPFIEETFPRHIPLHPLL